MSTPKYHDAGKRPNHYSLIAMSVPQSSLALAPLKRFIASRLAKSLLLLLPIAGTFA